VTSGAGLSWGDPNPYLPLRISTMSCRSAIPYNKGNMFPLGLIQRKGQGGDEISRKDIGYECADMYSSSQGIKFNARSDSLLIVGISNPTL